MREAINENRTVQLALVGVLALLGGLFLLKTTQGSSSEPSADTGAVEGAATTAPAPTASDPAAAAPVAAATPTTAAAAVPVGMVPGPGLPKRLQAAWDDGKAIVLLVRRAGGIDDALVSSSVKLLRATPNVEVEVTKARRIYRYSWLTQGVNVTELPALVVLRPRKLTKGTPTASVSYGFRNGASVAQAVKDALYAGPSDRPYHP